MSALGVMDGRRQGARDGENRRYLSVLQKTLQYPLAEPPLLEVPRMSPTTQRIATALLVGGLAMMVAFVGPASAGTPDSPEIEDQGGDAAVNVASTNGASFAGLFDIEKAYVYAEDKDGITFRFHVTDIPDDWVLDQGAPGAGPVPPYSTSAEAVPAWDPEVLRNAVDVTLHFKVGDKQYSLLSSLAAMDLQNPNALPKLDSREFVLAALTQAEARLETALDKVDELGVGTTSVSAEISKQITAARGQIQVAHAIASTTCLPAEESAEADEADSATEAEPTCATRELKKQLCPTPRTGGGSERSFDQGTDSIDLYCPPGEGGQEGTEICLVATGTATVNQCQDWSELQALAVSTIAGADASLVNADRTLSQALLPTPLAQNNGAILRGATGQAHSALDGARLSLASSAWFSVGSGPMPGVPSASPTPSAPNPKGPEVVLFHRFALMSGTNSIPYGGIIDQENDFVQITVRKADLGSPQQGDLLSNFRADSSFGGRGQDYAPDLDTPAGAPIAELGDYTYGKDYAFAAGGAQPSLLGIEMTSVDANAMQIKPGGVATYHITVKNTADVALAGVFALSADAASWTSRLDKASFTLKPGETDQIVLTVTGLAGGPTSQTTQLDARVTDGKTSTTSFTTSFAPASGADTEPVKGGSGGAKSILGMSQTAAVVTGSILGAALLIGVATAGIYMVRRK